MEIVVMGKEDSDALAKQRVFARAWLNDATVRFRAAPECPLAEAAHRRALDNWKAISSYEVAQAATLAFAIAQAKAAVTSVPAAPVKVAIDADRFD